MMFLVTMNMPSKEGRAVHNMYVKHDQSASLDEFMDFLCSEEFVMVEEFYVDNTDTKKPLQPRGRIAINSSMVGKIREYR